MKPTRPHDNPSPVRRLLALLGPFALALPLCSGPAGAASIYTDTDPFFDDNGPGVSFENSPSSEWSEWDVFGPGGPVPINTPFSPDVSGTAGQPVSGAPETLTGGPDLSLTSGSSTFTSGGNIYSFATPQSWSINDAPAYVDPLSGSYVGDVVLQTRTVGSALDYNSVELEWTDSLGNTGTSSPSPRAETFHEENLFPIPGGGTGTSTTAGSLWSWDLSALNVTDYEVRFDSGQSSSVSLTHVRLDSLAVIPEPSRALLLGLAAGAALMRRRRPRHGPQGRTVCSSAGKGDAATGMNIIRPERTTARAFTLVELLVAVVILGLLAGLTFSMAKPMIDRARAAEEVSAMRSLMIAYLSYPRDHHGELMPGVDNRTGVEHADGSFLPGFMAQRYPIRLGPYLDWDFEGSVLVGEVLENAKDDLYTTSVYPSFGINGTFVGGAFNTTEPDPDEIWAIRSLSRAERPADQLVFASSRHVAFEQGSTRATAGPGYYQVLSPRLSGRRWAEDYQQDDAFSWGYVDLRFGGRCVAGFLDGSVRVLDAEGIQDMRLWSPAARLANDPDHNPM